ncbi:hypothetical protein CLD22_13430 [Rubrivivax gelatinosus]|nr:hypothetical protein [Rubrivivax gelatinosus]
MTPERPPRPAWPRGAGSTFREDHAFLCRGDDRRVYRVVRREQWVASTGIDGQSRWQPTGIGNYAVDDGRPVGRLDDGRFVVARTRVVLTPI